MRKLKYIILLLLFSSNTFSQYWAKHIHIQSQLTKEIKDGTDWQEILELAETELKIEEAFLSDIKETIRFKSSILSKTKIDSFFLNICDSTYTVFPYRRSGYLSKELYAKPDTSLFDYIFIRSSGKSLYPEIVDITNQAKQISFPELIKYLSNDAATRLTLHPPDWDDPPFYLSISDVAIELLEIISFCDFYNNASNSKKLFSNLKSSERQKVISDIQIWYEETTSLNKFESVQYFLDSLSDLGHSYTYTCDNLLFAGDTTRAIKAYTKKYEQLKLPCRKEWNIGKKLLSLGDRRVIEDCMNTAINFRCMTEGGMECIEIMLESDKAYYKDNLFAEIIAIEPHSQYRNRQGRSKFIWHKIFGEIADYNKSELPLTLIQLMTITDEFDSIKSHTYKWGRLYPEQIKNGFRICDLALIRYHETIEELSIENWNSKKERDKLILELRKKHQG